MYIREVHIDGFGIFRDKQITDLGRGLTIFYGPNEIGKSTVLEFVRRLFFGFPRASSSSNPYPPLNGGAYGGKLVCTLDSGEEIIIVRGEGPHGGRLEVRHLERTVNTQDALSQLLGHMSRAFYTNVYAITLNEVEQIKSLEEEEIQDRLYGAELGLQNVSLTDLKRQFDDAADVQFKPRGSSQTIPKVFREIEGIEKRIRDIQNELSSYDDLWQKHGAQKRSVTQLSENLNELKRSQRGLENQRNLYSEFVSFRAAREKLAQLPHLGQFHEGVIPKLNQLEEGVEAADQAVQESKLELQTLEQRLRELTVNYTLIAKEAAISNLSRFAEQYKSAKADLPSVVQKRNTLEQDLKRRASRLGSGWSLENVRTFDLSVLEEDQIDAFLTEASEANRQLTAAQQKLEVHDENLAARTGAKMTGPVIYRIGLAVIAGFGLIGLIVGFTYSNWWSVTVSFFVSALSAVLLLGLRWGKRLGTYNALRQNLLYRIEESKQHVSSVRDRWREFLENIGLEKELSPEKVKQLTNEIERQKSDLNQLAEYDHRIERMQKAIEKTEALHSELFGVFEDGRLSGDVGADTEIMVRELDAEKTKKRDHSRLTETAAETKAELETASKLRRDRTAELEEFISQHGAKDEDEMRRMGNLFQEQERLKAEINAKKQVIESTVGVGEEFDSFVSLLESTSKEDIEVEYDRVSGLIEELTDKRDMLNQEIGGLAEQLERLATTRELLEKQTELELKKEQLQSSAREWARARIALTMLRQAVARYEESRQPEVIHAAGRVFSTITAGRYVQVRKPLEKNEIEVVDTSSNVRTVGELSRGTVEQLYFAMRLGLIEQYEQQSESMPVIMDDVLVNFDDERGPVAIEALKDFAETRQVIVMTCHRASLERFLSQGANWVEL